jgi:5,10-methylenetetrahydromethanopterin reductase
MRVDITLWPNRPVPELAELSRIAESCGFDALWWPDHYSVRDVSVVMAAVAAATERIGIGTGVCSVLIRHPAVLASMFASLAELSGPRVLAGLGVGGRDVYQELGLVPKSPLRVTRESVALIRQLLAGRAVSGDGAAHFSVNKASLRFSTTCSVPVFLAARGLQMCRLAGETADGLITHGLAPLYLRKVQDAVAEGAGVSGRAQQDCEVAVMLGVCVDENVERARDVLRPGCCTLAGGSYADDLIPDYGLETSRVLALKHAVSQGDPDAVELIDDDMVDAFSVGGPEPLVVERLSALSDVGVGRVILGWGGGQPTRREIEILGRVRDGLSS